MPIEVRRLNFDANASYGVSPGLLNYLSQEIPKLLNPSSIHIGGQRARALIEDTRELVRNFIGADRSDKVVFTSGASEANNQAILNSLYSTNFCSDKSSNHYITSLLEHPSVSACFDLLDRFGWSGSRLIPIGDKEKVIHSFVDNVTTDTRLVSLMYANNETGDIYPVKDIFNQIRFKNHRILLHCDAVQAFGKMRLKFNELGADLVTLSGHKIGALPGVGILVIRQGVEIEPHIRGGAQERSIRAGTENVAGIISVGWIIERLTNELESRIQSMAHNKQILLSTLSNKIPDIQFNSSIPNSLVNTINLMIPGVSSDDLVVALDLKGISISSGAACSSGKPEPSMVLINMGLSPDLAKQSIRLSFTHECTEQDVVFVANMISESVNTIRRTRSNQASRHFSHSIK